MQIDHSIKWNEYIKSVESANKAGLLRFEQQG